MFWLTLLSNKQAMRRKLIFVSLLSVLMLMGSRQPDIAVEARIVPGKMIIQFHAGTDQKAAIERLEHANINATLKAERCLSEDLGIWLVSYNPELNGLQALKKEVLMSDEVANAQFEHFISLREVFPDDPLFANQWHLRNSGQSGGVPGADIDATNAWEYTVNNGTTLLGDTIVMAIVDDGFSLTHEDMDFWKNRNEIPDNGIDDDNNGYIDDYDGWNAYNHNGDIPVRDHGMHVSGIAGAIGNNNTGVSGINWHGRILAVAGSSNWEGTVVEAYGYVYKMRSLYNETNGAEGAYVVVTNSSFGVNFGDPEDYPIWGAMYDSLGRIGILSAAATMNYPADVDVVGDIPTSFPSEYLIGVTNTTNMDVKNAGAAWGTVSIDLGAPGTSVMSTRIPNDYGYKTGTSMASPQLAGCVGLMFAAAGEAFLQTYHEQPGLLAVFLKDLILDGVDHLPGFDTLCVSGGRLNANNAIQKLVNPRIEKSTDTLSMTLVIGNSGQDSLEITNLLGFSLPYQVDVASMPSWLTYVPASGILGPYENQKIVFNFDAAGMTQGNYYTEATITDVAGMEESVFIELVVVSSSGIFDYKTPAGYDLLCYPNPFNTLVKVNVNSGENEKLNMRIYSLEGQVVYSRELSISGPGKQIASWDGHDLNGNGLPAGVYILQIFGASNQESVRIIKSRE
jgi:hypothetical protein